MLQHRSPPGVTTPNEDQYLAVAAKRNKRSTASDLSRKLSSATGTTVSRQTVYRRLWHIGLYARRSVRCVPLTATHCHLRLNWSREHALWTPQQWTCVMFSDESRFSLQSDSRRTLIWRAQVTRYHQENTIERHRYSGARWLVWRGIILGSRTDLHVQSVTMTGHFYRVVILEQHVCLFWSTMGAEFRFLDDSARPHRSNIVDDCLQSEDITRMDWPAYSPDLYPIEHVWDMLGQRIAARQPPPTCLSELRRALLDEWCNIPQHQINNSILSMPRRCKPPGQPIGVNVHWTQHPIREQPLSCQPSQKTQETFHPDEAPYPLLPDSIVRPIAIMPLNRMENTTFAMLSIINSHDMGLRTVLQSGCPKKNAYSTKLLNLSSFIVGFN
ncbi:transposable element Tcb1 transposase [Trichonephila clavipes]|nr:transposable element Tcb1 transposase [Trichonephila clavipes]